MIRSLALLLLLVVATGCNYQLVGTGSSLPPGIKTVKLPTMVNRTPEPNLDLRMTQALTQQFLLDGRLKVVEANPDSILSGTVVSYVLRPLAYDGANNVTEYQVTMGVEVVFTDTADDKILLKQIITDTSQYSVTQSVVGSEGARDAAVKVAAQKMAERIISTVVEGF